MSFFRRRQQNLKSKPTNKVEKEEKQKEKEKKKIKTKEFEKTLPIKRKMSVPWYSRVHQWLIDDGCKCYNRKQPKENKYEEMKGPEEEEEEEKEEEKEPFSSPAFHQQSSVQSSLTTPNDSAQSTPEEESLAFGFHALNRESSRPVPPCETPSTKSADLSSPGLSSPGVFSRQTSESLSPVTATKL